MEERKSLLNRSRGLLAEFGIWVGRSAAVLIRKLPLLADEPRLPDLFKPILLHTLEHLRELDLRIEECLDKDLRRYVRTARLFDEANVLPSRPLPELLDVRLLAMSPQAFTLTGFERAGGVEYAQSWLVSDRRS